jgi:hypothetical protein
MPGHAWSTVVEPLCAQGGSLPLRPHAFGALVAAETEKWAKMVKAAGAKAE